MNKIMIVGCPGSGKSTLSKRLAKKMNIPLLHLDYIYHIDNFKHISRDELKAMVEQFASNNDQFIIDGNYGSTLEWRLQFCDTVVLLDIDTDICVRNVLARMEEGVRDDMAPGFDNTKVDESFLAFVKNFKVDRLPSIKAIVEKASVDTVIIQDYKEMTAFFNNVK